MTQPFFTARNKHGPSCGNPPVVDWSKARFSSYYENPYGEQWVCWQDDLGIHVAGGDLGWQKVSTYQPEQLLDPSLVFPYLLGEAECLWLGACFTALLKHNGYASERRSITFRAGWEGFSGTSILWLVKHGFISHEVFERTVQLIHHAFGLPTDNEVQEHSDPSRHPGNPKSSTG